MRISLVQFGLVNNDWQAEVFDRPQAGGRNQEAEPAVGQPRPYEHRLPLSALDRSDGRNARVRATFSGGSPRRRLAEPGWTSHVVIATVTKGISTTRGVRHVTAMALPIGVSRLPGDDGRRERFPRAAETTNTTKSRTTEAAIRRALAKPVELKYDKLPLGKVAEDLERKLGVPVRLDDRPLKDGGAMTSRPVIFASSRVSAKATIALLLHELELTSVIRDEALLITTLDEADTLEETRVYEVADLIRARRRLRLSERLDHDVRLSNGLGDARRKCNTSTGRAWCEHPCLQPNTTGSRRDRGVAVAVAVRSPQLPGVGIREAAAAADCRGGGGDSPISGQAAEREVRKRVARDGLPGIFRRSSAFRFGWTRRR